MLVRRAWSRLRTREVGVGSESWLEARRKRESSVVARVRGGRSRLVEREEGSGAAVEGGSVERVMQSSVRLRHMLSALRRSCRSMVLGRVEGGVGLVILARVSASRAVASRALKVVGLRTDLDFARAEWRFG